MISDKLRLLKEQKGLTAKEIARRSGVPESTVQRILSGESKSPTFQNICDILVSMGESVDAFIENPAAPAVPALQQEKPMFPEKEEQYLRMIRYKNSWIAGLAILLTIILFVLLGFVLFDFANRSIGYLR